MFAKKTKSDIWRQMKKRLLIRRYAITHAWEREREERVMLTVNLSDTDHYRTKLLITELSLRDVAKPLMIEGMNE